MASQAGNRSALLAIGIGLVVAQHAAAAVSAALEDSLRRIFVDQSFLISALPQVDWLEDGAAYVVLEESTAVPGAQDIVRYGSTSHKREVLVSAQSLIPRGEKKPLAIEGYEFSKDKRRVLLFTNSKPGWRRNTRGDYWLLDLQTKALRKLGGNGEPASLQFAKFSADGEAIAFVRQNNLFVQELEKWRIRQLTRDGSHVIVNGTTDWVYEEELGLSDAFRWSPDGRHIAFWRFDSSGVGEYPLVNYTDSIYPSVKMIPYPKAGTRNSAVSIGVVDVRTAKVKWMELKGDPRNQYIVRMEWAGNSHELAIEQMNRLQNTADLLMADARSGKTRQIFEDRDKAWLDFNEIEPLGESFVWLSERDGWRHAYLVHRDGSPATLLTPGNFDVISLDAVVEKERAIYFSASPENAAQRYLYRVEASGGSAAARLTPAAQTGFHFYRLAPGGEWGLHGFSRFDSPWRFDLVRVRDGEAIYTFSTGEDLRKKAEPLLANRSEFFQVDIGGGVTLDGWMIRPKDFDPTRKYPVLVYVYGEPAEQTVLDFWGDGRTELFHRALAQDGYIVVSFDNRGTPAPKGREWRKVIYGAVGPLAAEEQTKAIKALCRQRAYLDSERMAIWGWSGGATDTLNVMFRSPDLFKVGMAVAPVPDQRLYDTIYQERYMGLPQDNAEGYRNGSAISFAAGLKGKLLLVHGTGDDNVHFQGSQMLINKLVEAGKQFTFMEYPNRTHAISEGPGTTIHLYTLLAGFLEENLPPVR